MLGGDGLEHSLVEFVADAPVPNREAEEGPGTKVSLFLSLGMTQDVSRFGHGLELRSLE